MKHLREIFVCALITIVTTGINTFAEIANDSAKLSNSNVGVVVNQINFQNVSISFGFEELQLDVTNLNKSEPSDNQLEIINRFGLGNEGITYQHGQPILPAVSRFVIVPPNSGLELIVRSDTAQRIKADHPPTLCNDEDIMMLGVPDEEDGDIYPSRIAEMSEPVVIRGVRLVKVTTYPLQYDASAEEYIYYHRIDVEVRSTNDSPVNPVLNPNRRNRSREFLKYIDALAINGSDIGRDDPDRDQAANSAGHYLIVTHENCLEYAVPFIEWRRKAGYKVDIISVNAQVGDNPDQIKELIQEKYDSYLDEGIDPFDQILLIGDRISYNSGVDAQWIMEAEAYHADYLYACLEGNDHHPDVGISRWPTGNADLMELTVGRTLAYEANPVMDDPEWFTRGAVYAQWAGHSQYSFWGPYQHTNMRWVEQVLLHRGFEDLEIWDLMEWDSRGSRIHAFLRDRYNEGCNVMVGVASNYTWHSGEFTDIRENEVFPIDLSMGEHSDLSGHVRFRTGAGDELKGPVATTFVFRCHGNQAPFSAALLGLVKSMLNDDLTFGWSRVYAITFIETFFPDVDISFRSLYQLVKTDFEFLGDPGIQPWIGVPIEVEAEIRADALSPTTRLIQVNVFNPENEEAVEGAEVSLYAPGDIPEANDEEYAEYEDVLQLRGVSDQDGMVRFVLSDEIELMIGTPLFITVTGRNIKPFFIESEIIESPQVIGLLDYELTETDGNEDGELNPGEEFSLNLNAINLSDEEEIENISGIVSSLSPWIIVAENEIAFGDIAPGENEEGNESVQLTIDAACPDGEFRPQMRPRLQIEFRDNEDRSWNSAIEIDPISPGFILREVVNGIVIPEGDYQLNLEIENSGRLGSDGLTANLYSIGTGVSVIQNESNLPQIESGETSELEEAFVIIANTLSVPGSKSEMMLTFESEGGFSDTIYFELQIGESRENAPQGPDKYGYICFDDSDVDWDISPEYDWIEISSEDMDRDFDGTMLEFEGESPNDIGESMVIELPFRTQFYGMGYEQITICTKGFIAMGEQPRVINYQPFPMELAIGGGVGMIAPFWGDIDLNNNGAVYTFYDEERAQFIIEWYRLRHHNEDNMDLTFQVILYDPEFRPSYTGDASILFQYESIDNLENVRGNLWGKDLPYASVGISSPDGTTGIGYTYGGEYPVNAAELENRRAILFSTSPTYPFGVLLGRVTDAETNEPVEDVTVVTGLGQVARTDEEGYYSIDNALTALEFRVTVTKFAYNDSTEYGLLIEDEGDTLEMNFNLLHPEFNISDMRLDAELEPNLETELSFDLTNNGNGPVDWQMRKRLPGDADLDPWEFRESFFVGDSTGDSRMRGVVWANDHFYCTGGGRAALDDNFVYILDRDGNLTDQFPQFGRTSYGMGDLAWDGGLIWGGEDGIVYGFTPEGELQETFNTNLREVQAVAWDVNRQILWCADKLSDNIIGYDLEGQEQLRLPQNDLMIYGLAYWPDDPDGYPLYIYHSIVVRDQLDLTMVHKINPETGDTLFVTDLGTELDGKPEGAFITNTYDAYSWVYISTANIVSHDKVDIWQLDSRRDWYRMYDSNDDPDEREEVFAGRMEAEETHGYTILLNSQDLARVVFEGQFVFTHNAIQSSDTLKVFLDVIGNRPPSRFGLVSPADSSNLDGSAEPEVIFSWEESIDPNWGDLVGYQLWLQSGEDSTLAGIVDSTSISVDIESLNIELQPRLKWWVVAQSDPDLVWSDSRFVFNYIPYDVVRELTIPIEFGLESIYPSPFNSIASIRFGMDRSTDAKISIFDISGREVTVLHNGVVPAGHRKIVWNAESLPSGLYLVRLESVGRVKTAKVALIR